MPNRSALFLVLALTSAPLASFAATSAVFACRDAKPRYDAPAMFDRAAAFMPGARWKPVNAEARAHGQAKCRGDANREAL
jgi:hypothetical protein